jgi:hypothetical protein
MSKVIREARAEEARKDTGEFVRADFRPSAAVMKQLTLREQYTYQIMHPENYLQTCGRIMTGGYSEKEIAARLPFFQIEYYWSRDQGAFFRENKDSVLGWIAEDVRATGRVGLNYKYAIVECRDRRIVPLLIATYQKDGKDHDILTVLLLLMWKAKYPPFEKSGLYLPLYGPNAGWGEEIAYNSSNVTAILDLAKKYSTWTEDVSSN